MKRKVLDKKVVSGKVGSPIEYLTKKDGMKYRCHVTYYLEGDKKRYYAWGESSKNKSKALILGEKKLKELLDGDIRDPGKYTVSEVLRQYREKIMKTSERELALSSKTTYVNAIDCLIRGFGADKNIIYTPINIRNKRMKDLSESDVHAWINTFSCLYNQGMISYTIYDRLTAMIKRFLEYAYTISCFSYDNMVRFKFNFDLAKGRKKKKQKKDNSERLISESEFRIMLDDGHFFKNGIFPYPELFDSFLKQNGQRFLKECRYYILFSIMFYAGLRTSEIRTLSYGDVIFDTISLSGVNHPIDIFKIDINKGQCYKCPPGERHRLRSGEYKRLKTANADRFCFIEGDFVSVYGQYVSSMKTIFESKKENGLVEGNFEEQPLFPSPTPNCIYLSDNAIDNQLKKLIGRLKNSNKELPDDFKFTKHDFRRTRITIMLDKGFNDHDIISFFGESARTVIQQYYNKHRKEQMYNRSIQKITPDAFDFREQREHNIKHGQDNMSDDLKMLLSLSGEDLCALYGIDINTDPLELLDLNLNVSIYIKIKKYLDEIHSRQS